MKSDKEVLKNEKNEKNEDLNDKIDDFESSLEDEDIQNDDLEKEESIDNNENIEKLLEENKKLKDDFLRAFAEAENVKKRCHQEMEKSAKFAIADFAKNLLQVADNLQRALDAVAGEDKSESICSMRKGIELTQTELMKVFNKFNIHKMDIMGKIFDPNFHQVVQEVEDKSKPAGTVIAEVQTGYMIHDRILREAMVVVTK